MNDNNVAAAIWSVFDSTSYYIQVSVSNNGGKTWSDPITLDTQINLYFNNFPKIAINNNGVLVASWIGYDGTTHSINEAHSNDLGYSWSKSILNSNDTLIDPYGNERIVINDNDNAIITWPFYYDPSFINSSIQEVHSSDSGKTWSSVNDLISSNYNDYLSAALNDKDVAIIVWSSSDFSTFNILQSVHSNNGGENFSTPISSENNAEFLVNTNISLNNSNEAVVVVEGFDTFTIFDWHTSNGGSSWSNFSAISNPLDGHIPQVAMNSSGEVISNWQRISDDNFFENHSFDGGKTWQPVSSLISFGAYTSSNISINNSGQIVMIAEDSNGKIFVFCPKLLNVNYKQNISNAMFEKDIIDSFNWQVISPTATYDIFLERNYQNLLLETQNLFYNRHNLKDLRINYFLNWTDGLEVSFPYIVNPIF